METKRQPLPAMLMFLIALPLQEISTTKLCPHFIEGECTKSLHSFYDRVGFYSVTHKMKYLCDTKTDGGGWIIFQRRVDRDVSFSRNWTEYKEGFGTLCGDYWLGNDNIHHITKQGCYELRIDMEYKSKHHYVQYMDFSIDDEPCKYKLHFRGFKGDTADGLRFHNDQEFATQEMDSDPRTVLLCPHRFTTGWWYNICHQSNLNGQFNSTQSNVEGVYWEGLTAGGDSLTSVEMKMRKI